MVNLEKTGLRFAKQDGILKHASDFDEYRGVKNRDLGLTCPECELPLSVKLPKTGQRVDHFSHHPDSPCPLRDHGETAMHLNAKIGLAREIGKFHHMRVVYQCQIEVCRTWNPIVEIPEYDAVVPELKIGRRRPDVCCLNGNETVGAAEVFQTNAVDEMRRLELNRDLPARWFEIPAKSVNRQYFKHYRAANIFDIDAAGAGLMYPEIPVVCDVCSDRRRKEAAAKAAREADRLAKLQQMEEEGRERIRRAAYDRETKESAGGDYQVVSYEEWKEKREAYIGRQRVKQEEDIRRARELEAIELAERLAYEQREGPAVIVDGILRIPMHGEFRYRWWKPEGQSIYETLAELGAPLSLWKSHSKENPDLRSGKHADRCNGNIQSGQGFIFCVQCGYYAEAA